MKYQHNRVRQYRLGSLPEAPIPELAAKARRAAADGAVLLKNENQTLPLLAGERVSVFGRGQREYCKSGTGSGGAVNVTYVTNILDSLREAGGVRINEELAQVYADWIVDHPFDRGDGWAKEPWCQQEMPLDPETVRAASRVSDKALVILTRTAGEDKDNSATRGSWYLSEEEERMLSLVTAAFSRVAVVLNVGNIMDMGWLDRYPVDSVLYVWQGGMEGGRAAADVLTGAVNPSGKLTDTIAAIDDYPSTEWFGEPESTLYREDVFVGYRYFETFHPDRIRYPFGFGLSYTTFRTEVQGVRMDVEEDHVVTVRVRVTNTGDAAGREVVQVYLGAPQARLKKAERVLVAFGKTDLLAPGESDTLRITFRLEEFASYDDSGVTGNRSCYVLEAGQYLIDVGTDSLSAEPYAAYFVGETVVERCTEALAPTVAFDRLTVGEDGKPAYQPVPTRTYDLAARIRDAHPAELAVTGDRGIRLVDVRDGRATMDAFIAQFTDRELAEIVRGEGMNSPKVTPGTGSCFGGVTQRLIHLGVPIACTTDGPSGIRMDSGLYATSLPNGTCLASTWDLDLIEELFILEGVELTAYKVDVLLGPGINIHRNPLCGRNFEYFSEDPYLSGMIAAAMCRGVKAAGVSCTIKHFALNNQEWHRNDLNAVISERAAREIYLKPFEIAVKVGGADAIMTSYNLINGIHAASNYDLCTTILRGEWQYDGFVMTDWWAKMNEEGGESSLSQISLMVRAQNDVFMVDADAANRRDDAMEAMESGRVTRGEFQRCAANLCRYLMGTHAMERFLDAGSTYDMPQAPDVSGLTPAAVLTSPPINRNTALTLPAGGDCAIEIRYHLTGDNALVQAPFSVQWGAHRVGFAVANGTATGEGAIITLPVVLESGEHSLRFATAQHALALDEVRIYVLK